MKKATLIFLLVILGIVQAVIYWNAHLYHKALTLVGDPASRSRLLERAVRVYPWNPLAHFELGKALFELASNALGDPPARDAALDRSYASFMKSLRLDPGPVSSHFHLAQTLLFMAYLSRPTPLSYIEEFKKTALLTGHNTQVYFEVGKILLSRWASLPDEEKAMTLDILQKMLAGRDRDKFQALLEVWYLHAQDPTIIDRIIPDDVELLRTYGAFLGERSLSVEERHKALAKAEALVFERAKADFERGQRSFDYYQGDEARRSLSACVRAMDTIKFYQTLAGLSLIDVEEYSRIRKEAALLLAKIEIDETRNLTDQHGYIRTYLALEDRVPAVSEFEKHIKDRGLIDEGSDPGSARRDFESLAFRMSLDYKQNRYREITRAAAVLESSLLIVPSSSRESYVQILRIIGDSFLKLDYVYEAERYFRKALEISPDNLDTLLRTEKCYERLNDEVKAAEIRTLVASLVTPREFVPAGGQIRKGETRTVQVVSDGQPVVYRIFLKTEASGFRPLVSVFFGGRIVWEDYADENGVSFSGTPAVGTNSILVQPVNGPVTLDRAAVDPRAGS